MSKVIEAFGRDCPTPFDECGRHVQASLGDCVRVTSMDLQIIGECGDSGPASTFGGEQHTRAVEIHKEADVVVPAASGRLVNPDPADLRVIPCGTSRIS